MIGMTLWAYKTFHITGGLRTVCLKVSASPISQKFGDKLLIQVLFLKFKLLFTIMACGHYAKLPFGQMTLRQIRISQM